MTTTGSSAPFSLRLIISVGIIVVALSIPLWLIGPPAMGLRLSGRSPESPPLVSTRVHDGVLEIRFDIYEQVGSDHRLSGILSLSQGDDGPQHLPLDSLTPVAQPGPVQHLIAQVRLPPPLNDPEHNWANTRLTLELRFHQTVMLRFRGTMPAASGILQEVEVEYDVSDAAR